MDVIYFSGSGNTRHCAEVFSTLTHGKAVSIEKAETLGLLTCVDEIAFAYPTHYSNIPKIVKDFITQNGEHFKSKKVFIIVTMGLFSGDGAGVGARLLKKQGAKILGGLHLRMPDAIGDVRMLKKPMEENLAIINRTEEKIVRAVEFIESGRFPKDGLYFWHFLAGLFGQRLWFIPTAKRLQRKLKVDEDKCTGCGSCAKNCPTKSLAIKNGKAVFTPGSCTICYRCVNHCPMCAITLIGKKVLEQCRYELYEKELFKSRNSKTSEVAEGQ